MSVRRTFPLLLMLLSTACGGDGPTETAPDPPAPWDPQFTRHYQATRTQAGKIWPGAADSVLFESAIGIAFPDPYMTWDEFLRMLRLRPDSSEVVSEPFELVLHPDGSVDEDGVPADYMWSTVAGQTIFTNLYQSPTQPGCEPLFHTFVLRGQATDTLAVAERDFEFACEYPDPQLRALGVVGDSVHQRIHIMISVHFTHSSDPNGHPEPSSGINAGPGR
jgi:hypothetical protein